MPNDTTGTKPNRIWIELVKATSQEHGDQQCDLANRMLARLGDTGGQGFFYQHGEGYSYGGPMGAVTLADRGRMFNLDYLGRLPTAVPENVAADAIDILGRILYAHETRNNGAASGEAVLCPMFATIARDVMDRAEKAKAALLDGAGQTNGALRSGHTQHPRKIEVATEQA